MMVIGVTVVVYNACIAKLHETDDFASIPHLTITCCAPRTSNFVNAIMDRQGFENSGVTGA
jgi:hypothetical protein